MRKALYYPRFFIEDEKWLKFALLYLGEVVTIIPSQANINFSNTHRLVLNETDLLDSHSPTIPEVNFAADSLGNLIARTNSNPLYSNESLLDKWRDKRQFVSEIYYDKMSENLQNMFLSNEWGVRTERGLILNSDLAAAYMTILANVISNEQNIPTITDKKIPVKYTKLEKKINARNTENQNIITILSEIEVNLPANLENVSVERIIAFRNNERNRRNLEEFHNAIENMKQLTDSNISETNMLHIKKNLVDAKRQYLSSLGSQFFVGSGTLIGIYQMIRGDGSHLDFLREVLGLGLGLGAINGINQFYGNFTQLRTTSRALGYISDIDNLSKR